MQVSEISKNMKKKNQWQIKNIETNETSFFSVEPRSFKKPKLQLKNFIQGSLVVLISVLIIYGVVQANTTTFTPPSGEPSAQFYTLTDIYNRLNDNSTASEGVHLFTFADPLSGTHYTLTEIYNKIPTIDPSKLLDGTPYLGVDGTWHPALVSEVISTATFGVNNATSGTYDVSNLTVSNVYYGKTFAVGLTGTLERAGYSVGLISSTYANDESDRYVVDPSDAGGTLISGLSDIASSKYAWDGTQWLGPGELSAGYTYGDNIQDTVLTTATGAGTFNVSNLSNSVIKKDITWGVNLGSTGTYITTYTWIKESNATPTWNGVNEDLDWAKEIGGTAWWASTTYTYRKNDGTQGTSTSADYTAPPGGWNGSSNDDDPNTVYSNHDNQALHLYRVISSDDYNLGTCTSGEVDKGDLVFPDDSVWDKSDTKTYGVKIDCGANAWEDAPDGTPKDKEQDGTLADDSSIQLNNARNAPSALAIADAWDGIKNLVSCPEDNSYNYYQWSGTPSSGNDWYDNGYQQDGKNNDYYDRPAESWYKDWGSGAGTSRLPMIEEYERARQGTSNTATSLLYGTTNWAQYQWSAGQRPGSTGSARGFSPTYGYAGYGSVYFQSYEVWVVVAQ